MKKILVCEDSRFFRNVFADYLSRAGYAVVMAEDGRAALEMAAAENPDLVLLDAMLPEMDGYEVCRRLRAEGRDLKGLPVIMCTVRSSASDESKGYAAGVTAYLSKSGAPELLLAKIRELLGE